MIPFRSEIALGKWTHNQNDKRTIKETKNENASFDHNEFISIRSKSHFLKQGNDWILDNNISSRNVQTSDLFHLFIVCHKLSNMFTACRNKFLIDIINEHLNILRFFIFRYLVRILNNIILSRVFLSKWSIAIAKEFNVRIIFQYVQFSKLWIAHAHFYINRRRGIFKLFIL